MNRSGNSDGDIIQWRMNIPVSPPKVFAALNTDAGRAAFWAESAVEIYGHIEFRFINGSTFRSKIIERRPPYIFSIDYFGGPARFELTEDGCGGTDIVLSHEGVSGQEWAEVHAGWLNVLFPLKAWVAFGIDLRNHDPSRSWVKGYADS